MLAFFPWVGARVRRGFGPWIGLKQACHPLGIKQSILDRNVRTQRTRVKAT
jgi:hypothetical protein